MENASKSSLIQWRTELVINRIDKPTKIKKAKQLGYRAKQGYVVIRSRIRKGSRHRPKPMKGRKPGNTGRMKYKPGQSLQSILERRVNRKYPNMEVLNSYYVGEDGTQTFYEVILIDTKHPVIISDKKINWITKQRRRAFRGLTGAGKRSREL